MTVKAIGLADAVIRIYVFSELDSALSFNL